MTHYFSRFVYQTRFDHGNLLELCTPNIYTTNTTSLEDKQLESEEMSGTTTLHNPYAKKKPLPQISRKPLIGLSSQSHPDSFDETTPSQQPLISASREESSKHKEFSESLSRATSSAGGVPLQDKSSEHASDKTHLAAVSFTEGNSINLPLWQRLPSETISFGSAEILTVPELSQRFRSSVDGQYSKSVRVTGVVRYRYVHADASISLVLGDPLAVLNETRRKIHTPKQTLPNSLIPETPSVRNGAAAATKTPGTNVALTTTTGKRPQSSILLNRKKAPVLVYKKANTGKKLSFAAGLKPTAGRLKRPHDSPSAMDPLLSLVNALSGTSDCIWIVVAESQIGQCAVNDLVMVMGEVQRCDGEASRENDHHGRPDGEDGVSFRMSNCPSSFSECAALMNVYEKIGHRTVYYIQARIVRIVNGTNMKLHTDALLARRAFLQRVHVSGATNECP